MIGKSQYMKTCKSCALFEAVTCVTKTRVFQTCIYHSCGNVLDGIVKCDYIETPFQFAVEREQP